MTTPGGSVHSLVPRPLPRWEGPGDEAKVYSAFTHVHICPGVEVMAKPGDWHTKPLPDQHVIIEYGRQFSKVSFLAASEIIIYATSPVWDTV